MSFQGLYDIRIGVESDHALVYSSMLKGLYYGDSWFSKIPKHIFMDNYKHVISAFLTIPKYRLNVACLKEDSDTIIGYSITTNDNEALVWVFIKKPWRNAGVAKSLIPVDTKYVTHLNDVGLSLLPKLPNVVFNPFY